MFNSSHTNYKTFIKAVNNDETSCLEAVNHYLVEIERNKDLNIFLEVFDKDAKDQAVEIDQKIKQNNAGKLAGMVIAIKDNICYKNHKVSAASKIIENFESLYSSTVVKKLLEEDAIIIGRTNCDEFAMGSSNENSAFGKVLNPINNKMSTGGSSGGSAAAVAANLCNVSLGSDTGGSIRQPASFCGIVGLKPTYGRVSRYGLLAYGSSFDQIGPFSKSCSDAAKVLEVIAGNDKHDSTSSKKAVEEYTNINAEKKYKIAVPKEYLESEGLNPQVKTHFNQYLQKLKEEGHTIKEVSFPFLELMVPSYYVLTTAEASSNLSRYSGVIYGNRSSDAKEVATTFSKSRAEGFGPEVKRRIMLGTFVLSAGYYDAYYAQAQKVRRLIQDKTDAILKDSDLIFTLTTPDTAFESESINDPITMYLQDIFTVHANLAGNPAISIPATDLVNDMPFGLQVMTGHFEEDELFNFSQHLCNIGLAKG
ncbi:MAG: Asp-tRNA(Asn)/Glu-tRNA(Gln) amidotransferase subunit GatA [Bacteroidia bacterium]|nr:Asp-tRNA(Asn)/Glu-tRNA(Gln) amidotransferase subunit GatA [Bacteroidia bacterium]NNC84779.1 Asp-tRNA(Asn)/Glu-tRNA(Gln) amidotransferase subunit GatA [Bacteroidia bacterium]NNM15092.1 Asp-tRNA(Asn)/Glu-tRNA(Gln) amidotransferase subunit GatA [Bacteroidia bacterium]